MFLDLKSKGFRRKVLAVYSKSNIHTLFFAEILHTKSYILVFNSYRIAFTEKF